MISCSCAASKLSIHEVWRTHLREFVPKQFAERKERLLRQKSAPDIPGRSDVFWDFFSEKGKEESAFRKTSFFSERGLDFR